MQQNNLNIKTAPFIKKNDSVWEVMSDVIIALIPSALISYFAFGSAPFLVITLAILSAVCTEWIFSSFFQKKTNSLKDGSAIVTAILLAFTLAPFTPWYIVIFGSSMAIIFGKLLWGGLGKNTLNPALIGREFMTVFFPTIMTSGSIWFNPDYTQQYNFSIFNFLGENSFVDLLNILFFKPSGAIGEYSVLLLILGGLFLLLRRRISWHIPFSLLTTLFLFLMFFAQETVNYSLGGVLLGTLFMATDMPSSASTQRGKLFYGFAIGLSIGVFLVSGIKHEYMSYSILLANIFVKPINDVFIPTVWGNKTNYLQIGGKGILLTIAIILAGYATIFLHEEGWIKYLIFSYIIFIISRFCFVTMKEEKL